MSTVRAAAFADVLALMGAHATPQELADYCTAEHDAAVAAGAPPPQPDSDLIGRKISLDVSTCDDDAGRRIFGTVYEVQDGDLLATEDSRNWREPDSERDAALKLARDFIDGQAVPEGARGAGESAHYARKLVSIIDAAMAGLRLP